MVSMFEWCVGSPLNEAKTLEMVGDQVSAIRHDRTAVFPLEKSAYMISFRHVERAYIRKKLKTKNQLISELVFVGVAELELSTLFL